MVATTVGVAVGLAWLLDRAAGRLPLLPGVLAHAVLLKPTFAVAELFDAADAVCGALAREDLVAARAALRSLVSRDPRNFDRALIAAAAVESLAENASDSILAPWLAYLVAGLGGAYAYRAANTLDAMVGYHERYEYLGKVAARCDDLLNLVPARLTAVVLALGAALTGDDAPRAGPMACRDHAKTASPNAGWPMSAMAGALGVQLEKDEHFARARSEVRRARAYLVEALTVLGLRVVPPSANYLLVDVGDAPTVRAALLHRAICVRDCSSFGLPCHVRVGVRTLPECERLVAAFAAARIPEMVEANRICRGEPTGSGG